MGFMSYYLMELLIYLIPKDNHSIYFKQSMPYRDNVAAVIDRMIENDMFSLYKAYLHGFTLADYADGNRINVVVPNSVKSVWHFLRSKYVIEDNGVYGSLFSEKQITINLTHGMMCKTFGYLTKDSFSERKKYPFLPHRTATYVTVSSPFHVSAWSKALGIPEENVLITGLPRNDYFFSDGVSGLFVRLCGDYNKAIVWMPTYRTAKSALSKHDGADYEYGLPLLNNNNLGVLNDYLKEKDTILVIKTHTLQDQKGLALDNYSNIRYIDSEAIVKEKIPLYSFVKSFDALITDYSSIYYDFLILDKPILHIVDDFEEYKNTRGFAFENAIDLLPGSLGYSFDDILCFIDDVALDLDVNKTKRKRYMVLFNSYFDGGNSDRLLESVGLK